MKNMTSIAPDAYFMVHWWMIERIGLRANELLIFAYIYNISVLKGKLTKKEISQKLSIPIRTASRLINSLYDKGYVQKENKISENALKCVYWIDVDFIYKKVFK